MVSDTRPTTLGYYDFGFTPFFAARIDPRFCYCLFIPDDYREDNTKEYRLLVLIHGTERGAWKYRERFAAFANAHDAIILAPLFPCNSFGEYDLENYKYIECEGVRYDHVLLSMVDEVKEKYRLESDRFFLFGFSGGGHFTHRFFYLHPERLEAASIGAPGVITLLDERFDFWVGIRDWEQKFGKAVDIDCMRKVPVQMVIGADDRELWEIEIDEDDELWMPGAEVTGRFNRIQRIELLRNSFTEQGIAVRLDMVEGAEHECKPLVPTVQKFFAEVMGAE